MILISNIYIYISKIYIYIYLTYNISTYNIFNIILVQYIFLYIFVQIYNKYKKTIKKNNFSHICYIYQTF